FNFMESIARRKVHRLDRQLLLVSVQRKGQLRAAWREFLKIGYIDPLRSSFSMRYDSVGTRGEPVNDRKSNKPTASHRSHLHILLVCLDVQNRQEAALNEIGVPDGFVCFVQDLMWLQREKLQLRTQKGEFSAREGTENSLCKAVGSAHRVPKLRRACAFIDKC